VTTFSTKSFKGTPYGRARRPASAGSLGMAANHGGGRGTSGRPAAGAGVERGHSPLLGGSLARCL
jgi:hypothetical protein